MPESCFCQSGRAFSRCCGPYLAGVKPAPTAEALMRSRYSAFCEGNVDYLMATHRPPSRDGASASEQRSSLLKSIQTTQWVNLLIISKQKGQRKDKTGVVEFVAAYKSAKSGMFKMAQTSSLLSASSSVVETPEEIAQLHEKSQFVREGEQWFYTEGNILPPYQPAQSQLCWCGSGKKYKRCHA
ncbi:MAG: YchJ family metal-binding protein [Cyanobacteria bacterium J06649_4]